ncbi:hypothetical protein VC_2170 [Vibrio cholerae O1 biovar El Tor str. N16961]|uniref:Uncharacterized protein n=2 Tax=Vibrio cholerae TaxID=666 RepID=Q9KQ34_VIBCH|nr:hypothetical protein VC_2170 [Vibrio cholerae O1 biovar El Tor str. N16961]ACP06395.1 conserved hypothetical protein [Vibrio cholerae M66-2]ACP10276.1 conserved hypothetical protein [Vibrio cholerae O395]CSB92784.1 Uncharacterised protein [Vibrio cholerae]
MRALYGIFHRIFPELNKNSRDSITSAIDCERKKIKN